MSKIKVIRFSADWCGPCQKYAPIFDQAEQEIEDVSFETLIADEDPIITKAFKVSSIPTTIFIKGEEEVTRRVGVLQISEIKEILKNV